MKGPKKWSAIVLLLLSACSKEDPENHIKLSVMEVTPNSEIVGATVTISGSGFNPMTSENIVKFGSFEATVISATATNLSVLVPNGSLNEKISVTVNNQTADNTLNFTTLDFIDIRDEKRYPLFYSDSQVWFKKNLNYNIPSGDECYNHESVNCDTDGRFYQGTQREFVCPEGWKLPSKTDFESLLTFISGDFYRNLRIGGSSGFDIVLSGVYFQFSNGNFHFNSKGEITSFWTSDLDEGSIDKAIIFQFPFSNPDSKFATSSINDYSCIRCLKE